MYAKLKELAKKNKFYRCIFIVLIAPVVFCRLVKRYCINKKERQMPKKRGIFKFCKKWFGRWRIETYACAALIVTLLSITIIKNYGSDKSNNENNMKPFEEVTFQYTRGTEEKLYSGEPDFTDNSVAEYPKEITSNNGRFQLDVTAKGFEDTLYEKENKGQKDTIYTLVIRNSGSDMLTDIHVDTQDMCLSGYDEKLSALLQEAFVKKQAEMEENAKNVKEETIASNTGIEKETGVMDAGKTAKSIGLEEGTEAVAATVDTGNIGIEEGKKDVSVGETAENGEMGEDSNIANTEYTVGDEGAVEKNTVVDMENITDSTNTTEDGEAEEGNDIADTEDATENINTAEDGVTEEGSDIADVEDATENADIMGKGDMEGVYNVVDVEDITGNVSQEENLESATTESADSNQEKATRQQGQKSQNATDRQEKATIGNTQGLVEVFELDKLQFSLAPGEEVEVYLALPEGYSYGVYTDQIHIMATELIEPCSLDVSAKVYKNEGEPWQTTPDTNMPSISYEKKTTTIDVTRGFDFKVMEKEASDSGIASVKCYLNGKLIEPESEVLETAKHDEEKVVLGKKYHVDFKETGIQKLSVLAVDREGNQNSCEVEITVVSEEIYHVRMPKKIHLAVDPEMICGDSQIYNVENFVIENDSMQDVCVSIEEMYINVDNSNAKSGEEKKCSLKMSVIVDGEERCCVPITEEKGKRVCEFSLKGTGVDDEKAHQASLVFKGDLESKDKTDWHEGDLDIQYRIKLSAVK